MIPVVLLAEAIALSPQSATEAFFNAFNRHDLVRMERLYAPDARFTSSDFCAPRGKTDIRRTYSALFDTYPDIRDDVDKMIVQGDRVAIHFHARRVRGPQALDLPTMTFLRVKNGLIVEDDTIFDTGGRRCQP